MWLEFPPLILETTDHQLEPIGFFFPPWIYLWSGAPSPIVFQDPLADADRERKRERVIGLRSWLRTGLVEHTTGKQLIPVG
jgi:hypothetical protein